MRKIVILITFVTGFATLAGLTTALSAEAPFVSPVASNTAPASDSIDKSFMNVSDPIVVCNDVHRGLDIPINCVVTYVEGRPTMVAEFSTARSMNNYLETFVDYVANPFCEAANRQKLEAYFMVTLKHPRIGTIYSCTTGKGGDWVSLEKVARY